MSLFNLRRRHFRRTLLLIVALFTIVFVWKVQHLINSLNNIHDASSNFDLHWTLTKVVSDRPKIDLDAARARNRFAEFGLRLVKQPEDAGHKMGHLRIRYFQANDSARSSLIKSHFGLEGSGLGVKLYDDSEIQFSSQLKGGIESLKSNVDFSDPGVVSPSSSGIKNWTHMIPTMQQRDLTLTVLVISRPNNVLLRQAARKTWGEDAEDWGVMVKFVVGREENWDDIVDREDKIHNDVIVVEEEDTYDYLPNKVLDGFSWVLHQSEKPEYVMKVDDDTIVNLPYLVRELSSGIINSTQILGAICTNSTVVRDPGDKWAVSALDYPFTVYPTYAFGGGYVMSISAASIIVETRSKTFDWLHLEDVYITGILARKSGISHVAHPAFSYWTSQKATPCDFVLDRRITSVNHTEKEFHNLHSKIQTLLRTKDLANCTKNSGDFSRIVRVGSTV